MKDALTPSARLRRFIEDKAARPDVIVHELSFGEPAPELASELAGRFPEQYVDFLAEMNGVRFEWQARVTVNDPTVYTMNGGGIFIPAATRQSDWHGSFLLIDGFPPRGVNTYYRRPGRGPGDVEIVVGQPEIYPGDATFLCRTLDDLVTLAIQHDLQLGWADDLAEARRRGR